MWSLAAAVLVAATPGWMLVAAGFDRPVLGRAMAIALAAILVGALTWAVVSALEALVSPPSQVARADEPLDLEPFVLPEARGPIFADRELGAPLMSAAALERAPAPVHRDGPPRRFSLAEAWPPLEDVLARPQEGSPDEAPAVPEDTPAVADASAEKDVAPVAHLAAPAAPAPLPARAAPAPLVIAPSPARLSAEREPSPSLRALIDRLEADVRARVPGSATEVEPGAMTAAIARLERSVA